MGLKEAADIGAEISASKMLCENSGIYPTPGSILSFHINSDFHRSQGSTDIRLYKDSQP